MFKNKKAVIFDLDGTLVDSVGIYTEADKDIIELYGGTLPQNLDIIEFDRSEFIKNHTDKNTYINYCQYLIDKYNLNDTKENVLAKRLQLTKEYIKEKADFKPNAEVFINSLINKGFNIFLATSSSNFTINMYLKENMLIRNKCNLEEAFKDKVLTKEDVVNAKPDPEIYLKAIQMLELKPEDCIVIEDSLNGIQSAVNAGLEVISIYDRYSEACMDEIIKLSNYHVNNYLELIEILDNENI